MGVIFFTNLLLTCASPKLATDQTFSYLPWQCAIKFCWDSWQIGSQQFSDCSAFFFSSFSV